MNKLICYGCGIKLQSNDQNKDGYIPNNKLDKGGYCQRCFKIMNYGEQSKSNTPKTINNIINSINQDNKFVIFLVDFLSINSNLIDIFNKIKSDKLLLVSKTDLILKSIKEVHIRAFLKDYYKIDSDIKLISSTTNYGVESLTKYLLNRRVNTSYIVGLANSGKSTLINKLLDSNNSKARKVTTSYVPNTTLDFLRIKINEDLTLIDSPGFVIPALDINKKNKATLKPKTFQMKKGESIKIDDMLLSFDNNTSITLYMDNDLLIRKFYKDYKHDYTLLVNDNSDLIISGLGFINIKNKCNVNITNIDKEFIEVRGSVFSE